MKQDSNQRIVLIATMVTIIIAVVVVGVITTSKSTAETSATPSIDVSTSSTNTAYQSSNRDYKDGTYTATGNYSSPGGNENITVTVTLKGGVIIDTSTVAGATDLDSKEYQEEFISGYQSLVVGKNISSVSLSRVSGSSLTSEGFNNALSQIKSQAQS